MYFRNIKALISVLFILIFVTLLVCGNQVNYQKECFSDYPLYDYVIVLDAGHGGEDGGAIGIKTQVREKDINLAITKKIGRLFESVGATVVFTRIDENALCKNGFNKMEDMSNRARIIKEARPYIVISVHCNSFPQNQHVHGAQMFYYPNSELGKQLAQSIQDSIKANVDNENNRQIKEEDFFMLRNGSSTNVMIECGFLSCKDEEQLLMEEGYQDKIAYSVFDGTNKFILKVRTPYNI